MISTTAAAAPLAPQRCFILDLPQLLQSQRKSRALSKVRIMAMVVSITNIPSHDINKVDDGDTFYSFSSQQDQKLLQLDDGTGCIPCITSVEMVERLKMQVGQTIDCIGELHMEEDSLFLQADTLLELPRTHKDPTIAEKLRWLEITKKDQITAPYGYPCPEISSNDIFQIIDSNHHGDGVSIADLALVLDLHPTQVKPLIEDLQLQGLIYENEPGSFVPL